MSNRILYLYVKKHRVTGLLYFGKTVSDPYKYQGSGTDWLEHLKEYGKEVDTLEVWEFTTKQDLKEFAIKFSRENDIVKSKDWANLKEEVGQGGGIIGSKHSEETKMKQSIAAKNKPKSEEAKRNMSMSKKSLAEKGLLWMQSLEGKQRVSQTMKRKYKDGSKKPPMKDKHHTIEAKERISRAQTGRQATLGMRRVYNCDGSWNMKRI